MDRGAWQATVHGVAKSETQLSNTHIHHHNSTNIIQFLSTPVCALAPNTSVKHIGWHTCSEEKNYHIRLLP